MKRYESEDSEYFAFREKYKDKAFTLGDLDQFNLYVGIHNFARKKFLIDEFESTLDVTGHIYEFGTWKGATLVMLAQWYKLRRPQGTKQIYAFDSFEGLSSGVQEDGVAQGKFEGEYKSDADVLMAIVKDKGLETHVSFVVGDAIQTVPEHFGKCPFPKVSFALLDMDLYEPTKVAIDSLLPNIVPGGKIIFDEGTYEIWEGEQRALSYLISKADELNFKYTIKENPITRQSTTVFTRL